MATKPTEFRPPASAGGSEQVELFDLRPIDLDGFTLKGRSVVILGKPTIRQWQKALEFAGAAHEASPYWVGRLLAYAESRGDWEAKIDQALSVTKLSRQTLLKLGYMARHLVQEAIDIAPSPAHAEEVAALPPKDQVKFLEQATDQGWTKRELREEIRASKRRATVVGQAKLEGMFRVLMADCPWTYRDSGATADGSLGKAERHYRGMTIDELCALPVAAHAMPDAVLGFWVTVPLLYDNPGPREVLEAWGFDYKTHFVWDKVLGMPGSYSHIVHEIFMIATRGCCLPDVPLPQPKSILTIRRSSTHSEKPREFRRLMETHWTTGPYLELFGRDREPGWTVFGDDARLWADEAAG